MSEWVTVVLPILTAIVSGMLVYLTGERRARHDFERQRQLAADTRNEAAEKEHRAHLTALYQTVITTLNEPRNAVHSHLMSASFEKQEVRDTRLHAAVSQFFGQLDSALAPLQLDATGRQLLPVIARVQQHAIAIAADYDQARKTSPDIIVWLSKSTAYANFNAAMTHLTDLMRYSLDAPDATLIELAALANQQKIEEPAKVGLLSEQ